MGKIIERRHAACSTTSAAYDLRTHSYEKDAALAARNQQMTLTRYSSPNALRCLMFIHATCHWRPVARFIYCTGGTKMERRRWLMQPIGEIAVIKSLYQFVPPTYRRNRRVVLREGHYKSEFPGQAWVASSTGETPRRGCLHRVCMKQYVSVSAMYS